MKLAHQYLLSVLLLLCCLTSNIQAVENDLPSRLQAEADQFKQDIETLRGQQLIDAADLLTGTGLTDQALYETVKAKTTSLISEHEAMPKEKLIAEELNAMMRAMGSMNIESSSIIVGLVDSSTSRGVRNRAHRLHPKLQWFAQRNAIMQKPDYYKPGQDLMTHRYINLLTSNDSTMGRWALEEIDRRRGAEKAVYSKMREILEKDKESIKDDTHLDYLAWICKLLGRYDRNDSATLLQSIQNDKRNDKYFKKLKKHSRF